MAAPPHARFLAVVSATELQSPLPGDPWRVPLHTTFPFSVHDKHIPNLYRVCRPALVLFTPLLIELTVAFMLRHAWLSSEGGRRGSFLARQRYKRARGRYAARLTHHVRVIPIPFPFTQ